jgi:hypothetical protein
MNEEQAIFEYFSQAENLPLALSVAEQMDKLREQMNNQFWQELRARLDAIINEHQLAWQIELPADNTSPDSRVGLHCSLNGDQTLYLRPMMEQQYSGGEWRIYFGLIWSAASGHSGLDKVINLKASLQKAGFKSNESFLAWQWTGFHPRRKDFLVRYASQPEQLLEEVGEKFSTLLIDHREAIDQANEKLSTAVSHSLSASLDQLRDELLD